MKIHFEFLNEVLNKICEVKYNVEKSFDEAKNNLIEFEKHTEYVKSEVVKMTLQIFDIFKETKND